MSILDIMFGGHNGTSLAELIPQFMNSYKGQNLRGQSNILDQLRQVNSARTDINNPMYQKIYGQQKQQGQQNLAESIQELVNQNRKLSSLGRTPLFDNERGSETLFRGLTKGYMDAENQAAGNTQNILGNASSSLGNAYGLERQLAEAQFAQKNQRAQQQGGVIGILKGLFGL